MKALLETLFIIVVVLAGVGFVFQHFFYWTLRRHYSSLWQQLGRPSLICNLSSTRSVLSFLLQQKYQVVGDARLVRLASLFRSYLILFAVLFGSLVIAFVIYIVARP